MVWFPDFAVHFFQTFASQLISFPERDESLVENLLTLDLIGEYATKKNLRQIAQDCDFIMECYEKGRGFDLMWYTASSAPKRYASLYGRSILVIIDEFQINRLCMSDPFFIYCVLRNDNEGKDLTTFQRPDGKAMEIDVLA